jgi:hypothetical protein
MKIRRTGLNKKVIALMKLRPDWTSRMIGEELKCDEAYVRVTARRNGLRFNKQDNRGKNSLGYAAQKAGMTIKDIEEWYHEKQARR